MLKDNDQGQRNAGTLSNISHFYISIIDQKKTTIFLEGEKLVYLINIKTSKWNKSLLFTNKRLALQWYQSCVFNCAFLSYFLENKNNTGVSNVDEEVDNP